MASKDPGRRAHTRARPEAPPGMTALDRASSIRTGMALAAVSGLLLILAMVHEQVGRPFGPIVTCDGHAPLLGREWGSHGRGNGAARRTAPTPQLDTRATRVGARTQSTLLGAHTGPGATS